MAAGLFDRISDDQTNARQRLGDGNAAHYLDGTGNYTTPAGTTYTADESTLTLSGTVFSEKDGGTTNAKLANMVQATVKGRAAGAGTGVPVDLSQTQLTALINAFTSLLSGAVPASGGGTANFLRADGTWAPPTVSGAALTKTDDTNVTATLGGSPTVALLAATSITLGWTGTLAIARGGTNASTAYGAFDNLSIKGTDVASAATTNIGAAVGSYIHITGTTTITAFDNVTAGIRRWVEFDGALTLTYNATSLILPTSANITTAAGDCALFISEGSGNWRCLDYQRRDGTALSGGSASNVTTTATFTAPAVGSSVSVSVNSTTPLATKQFVLITDGTTAIYGLVTVSSPSVISFQAAAYGTGSSGSTVGIGAQVVGSAIHPQGVVLESTFGSLPTTHFASREYVSTDSIYRFVDGVNAWDWYEGSYKVTDPSLASFSWFNQDGATLSTTFGGEQIFHSGRASAVSINGRCKTGPTAGVSNNGALFGLQLQPMPQFYAWVHCGFRESGTQKIVTHSMGPGDGTIPYHSRYVYSNSTTFVSQTNIGIGAPPLILRVWILLIDDGTNINVYFSTSGRAKSFVKLWSNPRTSGFTTAPDQVYFGVNAFSQDTGVWCFDYSEPTSSLL